MVSGRKKLAHYPSRSVGQSSRLATSAAKHAAGFQFDPEDRSLFHCMGVEEELEKQQHELANCSEAAPVAQRQHALGSTPHPGDNQQESGLVVQTPGSQELHVTQTHLQNGVPEDEISASSRPVCFQRQQTSRCVLLVESGQESPRQCVQHELGQAALLVESSVGFNSTGVAQDSTRPCNMFSLSSYLEKRPVVEDNAGFAEGNPTGSARRTAVPRSTGRKHAPTTLGNTRHGASGLMGTALRAKIRGL